MFGIGGFNPVSLLATAAFGPAGGIVAQLATQVFSQFGQQLLQNLGQQAGLPQSQIEFAQASFTSRLGDFPGTARNTQEALEAFGAEVNANPRQIGDLQRQTREIMQDVLRQAAETPEMKDAKASRGRGAAPAGNAGGAPGWLMAMAEILGEKMDNLADDMVSKANAISEDDPSSSAKFSVVSNQFSMVMNAASTAIKTVGEALSAMAKRQ